MHHKSKVSEFASVTVITNVIGNAPLVQPFVMEAFIVDEFLTANQKRILEFKHHFDFVFSATFEPNFLGCQTSKVSFTTVLS